jgi:hypothetical protein
MWGLKPVLFTLAQYQAEPRGWGGNGTGYTLFSDSSEKRLDGNRSRAGNRQARNGKNRE